MPKKLSQEEFIERCKKKHNSYYSYDKTVYTGMSNDDYIIVTCPIHGDFKQLAAGHIRGKGCKDCAGTITKNVSAALATMTPGAAISGRGYRPVSIDDAGVALEPAGDFVRLA